MIACGHRRLAIAIGWAEWQPNARASYDAAATTPRGPSWPTSTGLPRRDGSSNTSTDAKNASMSTWRMDRSAPIEPPRMISAVFTYTARRHGRRSINRGVSDLATTRPLVGRGDRRRQRLRARIAHARHRAVARAAARRAPARRLLRQRQVRAPL